MRLQLDKSAEQFRQGITELIKEKNCCLGEGGILIKACPGNKKELRVEFKQNTAEIFYDKRVHFFRGLSHVIKYQNTADESQSHGFSVRERVYFEQNGAMLDCSRNGVPKTETIKKYIRLHAELGLTTILLYTEDTYEVEGEPCFGAFRGRYTKEELKECDDYGELFGIEIIPCIQTLAHLRTLFKWKSYDQLRDIDDILLSGSEEVYALLDKMIGSISCALRSRKIHLGMDEAHNLGRGRYLDKNGYHDRFGIMEKHLNRVNAICRKYGLEPMMWSDMYFRLQSPTGDYYDLPEDTVFSDSAKPPENMSLVYWDYYQTEKEHYRKYFKLHRSLGKETLFAGGAWTWNGIAPNISKMYATTSAALQVCREENINRVMCTFWQDNGAETPLQAGDMALVLFAEYGFCEKAEKDSVKEWLDYLRGEGTFEGIWLLDGFDNMPGALKDNDGADNPSKYLFYQDVLFGLFDGQMKGLSAGDYYRGLKDRMEKLLKGCPKQEELFSYYMLLADFLSEKADLGIRIAEAYQRDDKETLRILKEDTLVKCLALLKEIRGYREKLWFEECKPFGYEVLDIRLGGLCARLESAKRRLGMYLEGEIQKLEELEEERIPYSRDDKNAGHKLCSVNLWENIVSPGNVAGV